jgi:hypothetical protein
MHGCIAYVHMQKSSTSQFQPLPHTHQKKSFNKQATGHHQDMHQNKKKRQNHKYNVPCSIKKHSQRNGWKFLT